MLIELAEFVIGLVGMWWLFHWINRDGSDDLDRPQDYMG
jgi:hypothetical protein